MQFSSNNRGYIDQYKLTAGNAEIVLQMPNVKLKSTYLSDLTNSFQLIVHVRQANEPLNNTARGTAVLIHYICS